jgi:hypothetical protein
MISLQRLPLVQSAVGRRIDTPPEHAQPLDLLADLLAPLASCVSYSNLGRFCLRPFQLYHQWPLGSSSMQ